MKHELSMCPNWKRVNKDSRLEFAKTIKFCYGRLRSYHYLANCTSSNEKCRVYVIKHSPYLPCPQGDRFQTSPSVHTLAMSETSSTNKRQALDPGMEWNDSPVKILRKRLSELSMLIANYNLNINPSSLVLGVMLNCIDELGNHIKTEQGHDDPRGS